MNLASQVLKGLYSPWMIVAMFLLSTLTLLFSMIVTSYLLKGVGFGSLTSAVTRGAGLIAVVMVINLFDWGILLAGPVWLFGLMFLFDLDWRQTRVLAEINWVMGLIWKVLLVVLMLL